MIHCAKLCHVLCHAVLQESKLKNMSIRSNLAVCKGDSKDIAYR